MSSYRTHRPTTGRHPPPVRQRPTGPANGLDHVNEQWLDQFVDEHAMYSGSDDGFSDDDEEDMKIVAQTSTPQNIARDAKVHNGRKKYPFERAMGDAHQPTRQARLPQMRPASTERIRRQGTREQVWNGTAERTKGGLVKNDLLSVPMGIDKASGETVYKLVSKKRSENAKKLFGYAGVAN